MIWKKKKKKPYCCCKKFPCTSFLSSQNKLHLFSSTPCSFKVSFSFFSHLNSQAILGSKATYSSKSIYICITREVLVDAFWMASKSPILFFSRFLFILMHKFNWKVWNSDLQLILWQFKFKILKISTSNEASINSLLFIFRL